MSVHQEFLTVSQLNQFIKDVINAGFPRSLWICGEIQQYERNRSKKHVFFELVEKDPDSDQIMARIGVVIFAGQKSRLEETLKQSENAFTLKDDIEVKFLCQVDFYPPHGAVRLIVEEIDPTYTLGKIAQAKQRLIALLTKKGVLAKNKQCPLPSVPLHIGLITSHDSAAYNDFLSELQKSGLAFTITMHNALMQGNKAQKDVCRALERLSAIEGLDVIVITRGGGSIAELSCFDSQMIAERIAGCPLPVLSGIGHEINITITDLAAHTYAKTPTAIARFLVERVETFLADIDEKLKRILEDTQQMIVQEKQRLKTVAAALHRDTVQFLKDHNAQIIRLTEIIKHKPKVLLKDYRKNCDAQKDLLQKTLQTRLANDRSKLKGYARIIDIVHPLNTIKRGFSITRLKDGPLLRSVSQAKGGQELTTELTDGTVQSKVLK